MGSLKGSLFRFAAVLFALPIIALFAPQLRAADKPGGDAVALAWAWSVAVAEPRPEVAPAPVNPTPTAAKCPECGPACQCSACAGGNCATGGVVTIDGKPYTYANGSYWPLGTAPQNAAKISEPARPPKFFNKDGSVCVECEAAETAHLARLAAKGVGVSCASGNCGAPQGVVTFGGYSACAGGNCGVASAGHSSPSFLTTVPASAPQGRGGFFANLRDARAERKAGRSGGSCASCR